MFHVKSRGITIASVCQECQRKIHKRTAAIQKDASWVALQEAKKEPFIDLAGNVMARCDDTEVERKKASFRASIFAPKPAKAEIQDPCWGEWEH